MRRCPQCRRVRNGRSLTIKFKNGRWPSDDGCCWATRSPQQQMGPTLLSAPSTPAMFPVDLGDRLSRVCFRWRCILLADRAWPALACPVARESRLSSPGFLAGVRSRQAVVPVSPASRLDLHPSPGGSVTASMPYRSGLPVRLAEAPLSFRPSRPLSKRPY